MRRQNFLELESGAAAVAPATLAAGWNALALRAIDAAQAAPTVAAQSLAILHTCMYNAWAAYDDTARQTARGFAVRLPRAERGAASKACAMGHAAHLALAACFPAQRSAFDAHFAHLGLDPAPAGVLSPAGIGRTQAASMLDAWRAEDGAPFAVTGHGAHGDDDANADPAAGPSPADWCRLAGDVSARAGHDDDRDVLLYFVLCNALADGALAAGPGRAGAAAAEALRRFTGEEHAPGGAIADEWGRNIGALVFERARRCWQGRP